MRLTRFDMNRKRNNMKKGIFSLLLLIAAIAAVAVSMSLTGILGRENAAETQADTSSSNIVAAFKYNYEITSKIIYRIELGDFKSFEEAEAFVKSIKVKRLNAYIQKEDGYKVVYGVFTNMEEANEVKESISGKAKGSITEVKLPGYNLKYNDKDSTFIQLVQASDKLLWEVINAKSVLSRDIAIKSKKSMTEIFDSISKNEAKLEKYMGYAKDLDVAKEQKNFKDNLAILLEDVLTFRTESDKDYYRLQNGLLNQVEAYRKFIEKLSS